MTVKNWLNRGYRLRNSIKALEKAKSDAWDMATSTTTALGEKVQESRGNSTENKLTAYLDYTNRIETDITKLLVIMGEIERVIMQVDDNVLRELLIHRYLNFETWESIAEQMHYSYVHIVHNLHSKALKKVKELIEFNTQI